MKSGEPSSSKVSVSHRFDFSTNHVLISGAVVYYPQFSSQEAFNNHFHRACWYLPYQQNVIQTVTLGVADEFVTDQRPDFMCGPRQPVNHITMVRDEEAYFKALREAELILLHEPCPQEHLDQLRQSGKKILNVTTDDLDAVEYGSYAKVHWFLMKSDDRKALVNESYRRFLDVADGIRSKEYQAAAIFGTGPSIDTATRKSGLICSSSCLS